MKVPIHPEQTNTHSNSVELGTMENLGFLLSIVSALNLIGKQRDALLVIASSVYILGYFTWSISAFRLDLGLLPALEAQYFMAGLVPAFIVGAFILAIVRLDDLKNFFQNLFGPEKNLLGGAFRYVAFVCIAIVAIFSFISLLASISLMPESVMEALELQTFGGQLDLLKRLSSGEEVTAYETPVWMYSIGLSGAVVVLSTPFLSRELKSHSDDEQLSERDRKKAARRKNFSLLYLMTLVSFVGFVSYSQYFKHIPQEFGGIGRRCAHLDLNADEVSSATLRALSVKSDGNAASAAGEENGGRESVVRTGQVFVVFRSEQSILVEVNSDRHELAPSIIQSVQWCDKA